MKKFLSLVLSLIAILAVFTAIPATAASTTAAYKTVLSKEDTYVSTKDPISFTFSVPVKARVRLVIDGENKGTINFTLRKSNGTDVFSETKKFSYGYDDPYTITRVLEKGKYTVVVRNAEAYYGSVNYAFKVQWKPEGTVNTTSLKIKTTKVTLAKGTSFTVGATVSPTYSTQAITYKSSNTKVATVTSAGKIIAKNPGTAEITVKSGTKTKTCTVYVTKSETIPYMTILANKTGTIVKGDTKSFAIKTSSSGTAVIKFSEKTSGEFRVTVKNSDGTTIYSKDFDINKTATNLSINLGTGSHKIYIRNLENSQSIDYDFTVKYKSYMPVKTTSVKLNTSKVTLKKGTSFVLKPTVSPALSTQAVTYKSSNTKVATVNSSGKILAKKVGTATITATSGSKTTKCVVTVTKTDTIAYRTLVSSQTGSLEKNETKSWALNLRTSGNIVVKFSDNKYGKFTLLVKDSNKKTVFSQAVDATYEAANVTIPLSSGKYRLYIQGALSIGSDYNLQVLFKSYTTVATKSIKLSNSKLSMSVGNTKKLVVTYAPSYSTDILTFKSSNTKVATISSTGEIKAVALGKTTITVKMGSITKTCKLTVNKLEDSIYLYGGESVNVKSYIKYISGYSKATWTSSSKTYATISSKGTIVAKKNVSGSAKITVKVNGTSYTIVVDVNDKESTRDTVIRMLKKRLKNPNSLIVNDITYTGKYIRLDYSAMNGFGGYNRKTHLFWHDGRYIKTIW